MNKQSKRFLVSFLGNLGFFLALGLRKWPGYEVE